MSFAAGRERSPDVMVIGGGIVGLASALELKMRGLDVTLIERGEEVGHECSSGNAGMIRKVRPMPLANGESVRGGLKWMWDSNGPLYIQPTPANVPWLARFTWASRPSQVARSTRIMASLLDESVEIHKRYRSDGMPTSYRNSGVLEVYGSEASFVNGCASLPTAIMDGRATVVSRSELRTVVPGLTDRAAGGILFAEDGFCNPRLMARAVADRAKELGVQFLTSTEVKHMEISSNRVRRINTSRGDYAPGEVVVAAGVWSQKLLSEVGVSLCLRPGKGYHVDYDVDKAISDMPVDIIDRHVIASPFEGTLRFSGTMELTNIGNSVRQSRVNAVAAAGQEYLGFNSTKPGEVWAGLRPMSADDVPLIGRTETADNLIVATGHSMYGVVLAPVTARLVADVATGTQIQGEMAEALSPDRFRGFISSRPKARN
jgi:D-amino-acid dehydrogenase